MSTQRLSLTRNGRIRYQLKTPYNDGTTHVIFEPLDFIAKLVALVPKPRVNLTRYHGVFAPNSKYRIKVPDIYQWLQWVDCSQNHPDQAKFRCALLSGTQMSIDFCVNDLCNRPGTGLHTVMFPVGLGFTAALYSDP